MGRNDVTNPIEWNHSWDPSLPSDGNIPLDPDEVYSGMLAAELFPVVWDIDYPTSNEHDILYWDTNSYAGGGGAAFDPTANPAAFNLGRLEGANNYWGAKRLSLDTSRLGPGQVEHFWLQVSAPSGGAGWLISPPPPVAADSPAGRAADR